MAIFTKAIIGSAVAGTIALGAMVTWDGGTTVNSAKDKITEAATQIGLFKQNETNLVNKVTSLKNEKATLTVRVADLEAELAAEKAKSTTDNERILELEAEIVTLNSQITDLEAEIETANADLENTAGNTAEIVERINALEAELNTANEQAEELQYTLDTTVLETPDQTAVDAALAGGDPVIDDGGDTGGDTGSGDTGGGEIVNMVMGTPVSLGAELVMDKEELKNGTGDLIGYQLRVTNNHGNDSYVLTVDGQTHTLAPNSNVVIGVATELDGKTLAVKTWNNTVTTYTLVNK